MRPHSAAEFSHAEPCASTALSFSPTQDYISKLLALLRLDPVHLSLLTCEDSDRNVADNGALELARLQELRDVLVRFRELFSSVHTLVDMRTFYDIYRPLLGGALLCPFFW